VKFQLRRIRFALKQVLQSLGSQEFTLYYRQHIVKVKRLGEIIVRTQRFGVANAVL
jgi:hypothetical protein